MDIDAHIMDHEAHEHEASISQKAKIAKRLLKASVNKVFEDIPDKTIPRKYLQQLDEHFVADERKDVGGVLPICIDPDTNEAFFLFGREKLRQKECSAEEFLYQDEHGRLQVRNSMCHFQGFLDQYENFQQGSAREGYEESRGAFASFLDIWRAVSESAYHHRPECIPCLNIISLGFMTETERNAVEQRFQSMPVYIRCMAEIYSIHFVPVRILEAELKLSYLLERGIKNRPWFNVSKVIPTVPDNSMWLRPFVQNWFSSPYRYRHRMPMKDKYQDAGFISATNIVACCAKQHLMICFPAGELPTRSPSAVLITCTCCGVSNLPSIDQPYYHCTDCETFLCLACSERNSEYVLGGLSHVGPLPSLIDFPYCPSHHLELRPFDLNPVGVFKRGGSSIFCELCDSAIVDPQWPYFYSPAYSKRTSDAHYHIQCILCKDEISGSLRLKDLQNFQNYVKLGFFMDPVVRKASLGGGTLLSSIFDLPILPDDVKEAGEKMLHLSHDIVVQVFGASRIPDERIQKTCVKCDHPIFVRNERDTLCHACLYISRYLKDKREKEGGKR